MTPSAKLSHLTALAVSLVSLLATSSSSQAQLSPPPLVLSSQAAGSDGSCEDVGSVCSGEMWQRTTGTYDFLVHGYGEYSAGLQSAEFTLVWPQDWVVQDWSVCRESLVSGDPTRSGETLVFEFEDCGEWNLPALRLTIACPSPGRFEFGRQSIVRCDGSTGGEQTVYVEVGDYCGVRPLEDPCSDFCSGRFTYRSEIAATALRGVVWRDTLGVRAPGDCGTIPECGSRGWCTPHASSVGDWFELLELGRDNGITTYEVAADTAELGEGLYTGLVYVGSGDDCCPYTCIEIALDVSGEVQPVLKRSWGQIKWDAKRSADEKKPDQ